MKPLAESFSTVIAGQWNPNIFKPDWVKGHLTTGDDQPAEVAFPIGDPSLPPRIRVNNVFIFPSSSRLDIRAEELTKENLQSTGEVAKKCLELLTHTPISALGINLGFTTAADDAPSIIKLFSFDDDAEIDSDTFKLQGAEIKRSFKQADCILNLNIAYNTTDIKIEFNFHFDIQNAEQAIQQIDQSIELDLYSRAEQLLKDIYGLEIEEIEDD